MMFLYFFYFFTLSNSKSSKPTRSVTHCGKKIGTYVIPIFVHIDPRSLIKIRTSLIKQYNRDLNTMAAATKLLGSTLDMINEELEVYGVQVESDYTKLVKKGKCRSLASSIVKMPYSGVNLYILDCDREAVDFHIEKKGCGINVGVSFGNLRDMSDTIKEQVIRAIAGSEYKVRNEFTTSFNTNLCQFSSKCGKLEGGVKSVRNLGSEEYMTGFGYEARLHDMYDDVSDNQNGDPEVYATEDYSNEDELYADFKK